MLQKLCRILMEAGSLNAMLYGLFTFDMLAWVCGGSATFIARALYTAAGLGTIGYLILLRRESKKKDAGAQPQKTQ